MGAGGASRRSAPAAVPLPSLLLVSAALAAPPSRPNPDLPLDAPYTLRLATGRLEAEYHRQSVGAGPLGFAFPRACASDLDTAAACGVEYALAHRDSARGQGIGVSPLAGMEWRYDREGSFAGEAGLRAAGHKANASFWLDARAFAENAEGRRFSDAYDREATDTQSGDVTGTVSYLSYARYRGGLALDLPAGRLVAARDAVHWGPALLGALVFHQDAVPFHQVVFTTHLGPVSVRSLYGDLLAGTAAESSPRKSLHAHRYEWRPHRDWVLGLSEQLILAGASKPYLFTPVFPLFIAKSFMEEDANNGNLAIDAAWRIRGFGLVYGEFLLDDLESPSSLLLEDYRQNKWAALVGAHWARDLRGGEAGAVAEAVRIEPWVYTHFQGKPAQASNLGYPLGNPLGPDALDLRMRLYLRRGALYAGLTAALTWKGTGLGSDVEDTTYTASQHFLPKRFLDGADGPKPSAVPVIAWEWRRLRGEASWAFGPGERGRRYLRLQAAY